MPNRSGTRLSVMDLRPTLAAGRHPLDDVLAAADTLEDHGLLELIAPFEPRPLMQKLRDRGLTVESALDAGVWFVRAGKGVLPALQDFTGFEPPEPMERVLADVSALPPETPYLARLPRNPALLLPHLAQRGLEHEVALRPDGTALLWVWRPG